MLASLLTLALPLAAAATPAPAPGGGASPAAPAGEAAPAAPDAGSHAAPAPARPRWTVTVDPLTAALGFAHVQVERALGDHASVYVGPSLRLYDGLLPAANGPYRGLGVEAGARWFPWRKAPVGPWVMLRGVAAVLSTTDGAATDGAESAPGGYTSVLVGGTVVPVGPLVLSGGLGVSYFAYTVGGWGVSGFLPAAHTNVGVAF